MTLFTKEEMFHFIPENGRLLDAMRKQLLNSLGEERAKGVLSRYGWDCGYDYARYLMSLNLHKQLSQMELIELVSQTHSELTNMETVVYERSIDVTTNYYYSQGIWKLSQEASKYIEAFGYSETPVCHTISGFISGFSSAIMGKTIIYKESACRAQRHEHCHWVGQSLHLWGNESLNEMTYFKEDTPFFELENAFEQIKQHNDYLRKTQKIHEKMANKIIQGMGVKGLIEILSKETTCDVIVENIDGQLLYSYTASSINYAEETSNSSLPFANEPFKKCIHETAGMLTNGSVYKKLSTQIFVNNQLVSYLSLIKYQDTFTDLDSLILEITSTLYALQLSRDNEQARNLQLIQQELLSRYLIMERPTEDVMEQIRLAGYQIQQPQYVFLIAFNKEETLIDEVLSKWKNTLIKKLYNFFSSYRSNILITSQLDEMTMLVPKQVITQHFQDDVGKCAQQLIHDIFRKETISSTIGISTCCHHHLQLKNYVQEATRALQLNRFSPNESGVITFEQFGSLGPILSEDNYAAMVQFAHNILHQIIAYDAHHQSELLKTLYWYLCHQQHLQKTAHSLNSSIGSVRYRLKKIEELTTTSLSNTQKIVDFHLALQMYLINGQLDFLKE